MTTKPTREEVIGLDARLRRYLHMPYGEGAEIRRVFDAYLALMEEVEGLRDVILQRDIQTGKRDDEIEQLKTENQALKGQVKAIIQAIKDEPELPGPMPNEMLDDIEKVGIEETMRIVVRETKKGILGRIKP